MEQTTLLYARLKALQAEKTIDVTPQGSAPVGNEPYDA
jgi:hypothetical protein